MSEPESQEAAPTYRLPTGNQIRGMRRMELEQSLRLAVREIHHLRCEIARLTQKLAFLDRGFAQEQPPLEAEMVRIPLVEGKLR